MSKKKYEVLYNTLVHKKQYEKNFGLCKEERLKNIYNSNEPNNLEFKLLNNHLQDLNSL